jgi:hypothetical protein
LTPYSAGGGSTPRRCGVWWRWTLGVGAGLVLAQAYGLLWFFVGPAWAALLTLMDLGHSEVRREG